MRYKTYTIIFITIVFQLLIINQANKLYVDNQVPEFTPLVKSKVLGTSIQLTKAIIQVETGGKPMRGLSGEHGIAQFLPATWLNYQKKYLATTTLKMTPENEFKVLVAVNEHYLEKGYTPYQLALLHNQGHFGKCKSGINKHGIKYDSCAYAKKVVAHIK